MSALSQPRWQARLVVHGHSQQGRRMPVAVGLVETAAGVQIVVQTGDGQPLILLVHDAAQLSVNLRSVTAQRLKITGESL